MTSVVPVLADSMVASTPGGLLLRSSAPVVSRRPASPCPADWTQLVVLKLACDALGAAHVHPVFLPYKASSEESRRDARAIVSYCGLPWTELDITAVAVPMSPLNFWHRPAANRQPACPAPHGGHLRPVQEERSLVIGTSSKSELLVGYSTWYGDMACAMMPIGDLYKTQVRSLATFLGIPRQIVEEASLGRPVDRTDRRGREIGVTYDTLDQVLFLLIDQRLSQRRLHSRALKSGSSDGRAQDCRLAVQARPSTHRQSIPAQAFTPPISSIRATGTPDPPSQCISPPARAGGV